jgi:hypothetical protein
MEGGFKKSFIETVVNAAFSREFAIQSHLNSLDGQCRDDIFVPDCCGVPTSDAKASFCYSCGYCLECGNTSYCGAKMKPCPGNNCDERYCAKCWKDEISTCVECDHDLGCVMCCHTELCCQECETYFKLCDNCYETRYQLYGKDLCHICSIGFLNE